MGGQELVEKGSPNRGLLLQTGWGAPLTPRSKEIFLRTQLIPATRPRNAKSRVLHARNTPRTRRAPTSQLVSYWELVVNPR